MAASQSAVATGGKSSPMLRISIPASSSGMHALLYDFQQIPESRLLRGLRMNKENRGSPRSFPRRRVDHFEAVLLHIVVRFADIGNPQRNMRQTAAPAALFHLPGNRRF